jgi:hypothetical protein
MTALLLVIGLVAVWWLVGTALLTVLGCETSQLRIVLTAPAIGTSLTAMVVFIFSEAGVPIAECAIPIAIVLVFGSAAIVAIRRPGVHAGVIGVIAVGIAGLPLVGWPMFSLGFGWLANGNDDMANYVLSAQQLLKHGVLDSIDFKGLAQGRDYTTVLAGLHLTGGRPGGEILLAFVSRVVGRPPYQAFMPVILAFDLCAASAAGALAMQFAQRSWAAILAAALAVVSPLAAYGVVQQLLAQVLGLGIAAALLALLMRPELHGGRGARPRDVIPIGVLATGLLLGYVELVPEIALAYIAYVALLGARRQLGFRAVTGLWLATAIVAVVVLNGYLFTELDFLKHQADAGFHSGGGPPLFGYILVPSALPGILGSRRFPPAAGLLTSI